MNEIVKYNNTLNSLKFKNFTAMDYNIFMCLCHKLRNQGQKELVFGFEELKDLTDFAEQSDKKFVENLESMIDKLLKVSATYTKEHEKTFFVLFTTFTVDDKKRTLTVSVNKKFSFILNELTDNFTRFELKEFTELDGKYTKTLYRVLKQYKHSGWWKPTVEELKYVLDVPENYDNKKIMAKIIKPSMAVLAEKFSDLKCEPIKAAKRGAPVERYYFTFQAEKQISGQQTIADYPGVLPGEETPKLKTKKKPKSNFNNFEQRQYTTEEMAELEKKLLDN